MDLITWDDSLNTGISLIDAQHKVLINKLNKLNSCMTDKNMCENLNVLLDELLEYTFYHFETEENYFSEFSYGKEKEHIKEHESFRKYLKEFLSKKNETEASLSQDLLEFLKKWIDHHIREVDMEYVAFLKDKI